uniref:DIV and RAD interacting factor 2 n=1 Tax=Antirrhinum majus TaxID=4151 RepID=R4L315_ANTMA|nr:DIV and RAD interacting factor 2 [Antirrhinum majus]
MASSSGTYKEQQGSVSSYNNGNNGHGEWGVPTFQHQQTISMEWTPEEQAILENGLSNYASESNIIRYAKIAVQLKNKTVRDVALRCRWMTKKEIKKKRKEDCNARKVKDRKEMVIDSCGKPPRLAIQSGLSHAPGMVPNGNDDGIVYNDINGATRQLLQQNSWAFKQISSNLATHQIHENIGLLSKARDNIFQLLINLNEMAPTTKKMGPLPKLNEDLANSILPPSSFPIRL